MDIGSVFQKSYQFDNNIKIKKIALNNSFKLKSPDDKIAALYHHVAHGYLLLGEYDSAKANYLKVLDFDDDDSYSNKIKLKLAKIKVYEKKYDEAILDLNMIFNTFDSNQDTMWVLHSLKELLIPLKELDKKDDIEININKMNLYINNYTLDTEKSMIIYWDMFKALQHINNDESDQYKNIAIKNMDKYLENFKHTKDKNNIKSNHKTVQEILQYQNTVIN
jgi:tetratricopeptide (TPR) repeat protein